MCMKRDIWTIVHDDKYELWLLSKQIESYLIKEVPNRYNVIINDPDNVCKKIRSKLQKFVSRLNKRHQKNIEVHIWFRSDFLNDNEVVKEHEHDMSGYINQQLLKLQVYKCSNYQDHVVLDAKNIFLTKDAANQVTGYKGSSEHYGFAGCYNQCCNRWFGGRFIKISHMANPFVFKRKVLKALEKDFGSRAAYFKFLTQPFELENEKLYALAKEYNNREPKRHNGVLSEFVTYCVFQQYYNNLTDFKAPVQSTKNRKNVFLLNRNEKPNYSRKVYNEHYFLSYHKTIIINHGGFKVAEREINKAMGI